MTAAAPASLSAASDTRDGSFTATRTRVRPHAPTRSTVAGPPSAVTRARAVGSAPGSGPASVGDGGSDVAGTIAVLVPPARKYVSMSLFRFSERVPKIACRLLPTVTTPVAPSALSLDGL